jgi:hypothetical protein
VLRPGAVAVFADVFTPPLAAPTPICKRSSCCATSHVRDYSEAEWRDA